jgi:hypothetical protein
MAYAPRRCELDVESPERRCVRYFEVSAEEHAEFMAAESKGTYLNQVLKRKGHPYIVMKRGGN